MGYPDEYRLQVAGMHAYGWELLPKGHTDARVQTTPGDLMAVGAGSPASARGPGTSRVLCSSSSRIAAVTGSIQDNARIRRAIMRLPIIPPNQVSADQRPLFDKLSTGIRDNLQGFTTQKPDGSLIGPFSALLHFPDYGTPIWDLFLALADSSVLPKAAREVVILSTAARFGSIYELYSHEAVAAKSGLTASKIATIAAGERPGDLTGDESVAYDVAAVLNRGHQVPNSTYDSAVAAFGVQGVTEIAYFVGIYCLISSLLNVFDVNLPGTELG
jgi:4-carboxymuconolactone decarboxylase